MTDTNRAQDLASKIVGNDPEIASELVTLIEVVRDADDNTIGEVIATAKRGEA